MLFFVFLSLFFSRYPVYTTTHHSAKHRLNRIQEPNLPPKGSTKKSQKNLESSQLGNEIKELKLFKVTELLFGDRVHC